MPPGQSQFVAVSCVNVGVGPGGTVSTPGRVSIVDYQGHVLLDYYIIVEGTVTDYRYESTGLTAAHLQIGYAYPQGDVFREVRRFIKDKVIVGYEIWNFLSGIGIVHKASQTRDVALYNRFAAALRTNHGQHASLRLMAWRLLARNCQDQGDSVETARVAMDLYRSDAEWEAFVSAKRWPEGLPPSKFSGNYN